ncbi:ENTH/VHS/GAT family protein [Abeliophyllum distichum]|uniref:ENTH/VHS/GAT family protein n=1 Tax=Abeliophyllum distichum TaxID=126358 RepID=A0ABD1QSW6_9LAMI
MISSIASISSSSSASVRVEKATSEFLIGPDWTMNIDICDTINSNQTLAKDVVKAVKKRLQHKNPKVQLLALTLLETMVKNCGDYVHFQIAERSILQEMVKIVRKKTDMHVRDKILVLIDSWREAFGGSGGRYPQYYIAYEDLRRSGVQFPQRSPDTAPIFTPPVTHPIPRHPQPGYGMPSSSTTRLDEAMAADMETLSLSSLNAMRDVLDLLADMLQAVDPSDRLAVKDEVIVDLVERCRANQRKLMQMLTTTGDEQLLGQGLELNDSLQNVLSKHDAIASGSPLPRRVTNVNTRSAEIHDSSLRPTEVTEQSSTPNSKPTAPVIPVTGGLIDGEEEEDDFAQLARRHSKTRNNASQSTSTVNSEGVTSVNTNHNAGPPEVPSTPVISNALVPTTPAPVQTSKELDFIDLLSNALVPISVSTDQTTQQTPDISRPFSLASEGIPFSSEGNRVNPTPAFNSYIAPWAQPQPQPGLQSQQPLPSQHEPPSGTPSQYAQVASQPQPQPQPQSPSRPQHQLEPRPQPQFPQYSSGYPPPPWAATPGYYSNPNPVSRPSYTYSTPTPTFSSMPLQESKSLQHVDSVPARESYMSINGDTQFNLSPQSTAPAGQRPFIPSYRLFEDLNVFGGTDGRFKATNNPSSSLSGNSSQSMVGGRK